MRPVWRDVPSGRQRRRLVGWGLSGAAGFGGVSGIDGVRGIGGFPGVGAASPVLGLLPWCWGCFPGVVAASLVLWLLPCRWGLLPWRWGLPSRALGRRRWNIAAGHGVGPGACRNIAARVRAAMFLYVPVKTASRAAMFHRVDEAERSRRRWRRCRPLLPNACQEDSEPDQDDGSQPGAGLEGRIGVDPRVLSSTSFAPSDRAPQMKNPTARQLIADVRLVVAIVPPHGRRGLLRPRAILVAAGTRGGATASDQPIGPPHGRPPRPPRVSPAGLGAAASEYDDRAARNPGPIRSLSVRSPFEERS